MERLDLRHRDTFYRTEVGFAANLDRAVFDQHVGLHDWISCIEFCFERQTKDRTIRVIDGDLTVITGELLKRTIPVIARNTTELDLIMRFLSRNGVTKNRLEASSALLPM